MFSKNSFNIGDLKMKIGDNEMKLCIKIFGVKKEDNSVKYKTYQILPYKSKKNKKFENDIWMKELSNGCVCCYMKLNTSYNTAKRIANEKIKS